MIRSSSSARHRVDILSQSSAVGLRWPSALAVFKDELAVAELGGRVTVLDKQGRTITSVGANESADEIKTNRVPPEKWQPNLFYAPHGIAYDASGDLLVTEWSQWGRVVRLERKRQDYDLRTTDSGNGTSLLECDRLAR